MTDQANIEPFNFQKATNIDEHRQMIGKINELVDGTNELDNKRVNTVAQSFDDESRILATTLTTVDGTEISGTVYVPGGGDGGDIVVDKIDYYDTPDNIVADILKKYADGVYECSISILAMTKPNNPIPVTLMASTMNVRTIGSPDTSVYYRTITFTGSGSSPDGPVQLVYLRKTDGSANIALKFDGDTDYIWVAYPLDYTYKTQIEGIIIKGIKGAAITPYTASTGITIDDENSTIAVDSDVVMLKSIAINYTDAQFIDVYNDLKSKFPNNDFTCNLNVKCVGDDTYDFDADSITIKDTYIAIGKAGVVCHIKPDGTATITILDSSGVWDVYPLTNPITIIGTVRNASTAITYTGENGIIVDNTDNVIKPDTDVLATKELAQKAYTSAYVENNTMTFERGNGDTDTIALPTGGSYTAGEGITISDNEIAVDTSTIATTAVTTELASGISANRFLINGSYCDVGITDNVMTFTAVDGQQKEITIPSGGDGWEDLDLTNLPTDFQAGDKIAVEFSIPYSVLGGTSWTTKLTGGGFTGDTHKAIRIYTLSDAPTILDDSIITIVNNSYICLITINEINAYSVFNNNNTGILFELKGISFNGAGCMAYSTRFTRSTITDYVSKMWRIKSN